MTDNVITFGGNKPKEPEEDTSKFILMCPCRCTTFQIQLDGSVTCAECDAESSELTPQLKVAKLVDNEEPTDVRSGDVTTITRFQIDGMDLARARTVRRVNEWYENKTLMVCFAYSLNNGAAQWSGIETAKERTWLKKKLMELDKWLDTFDLNDDTPSRSFADE